LIIALFAVQERPAERRPRLACRQRHLEPAARAGSRDGDRRAGKADRPGTRCSWQLGLVAVAIAAFVAPSVAGWHGDPERHSLAVLDPRR
jgi:hypothetical protein